MATIAENREGVRIKRKANILLENIPAGTFHRARMYNYSHGGMYFESDYAPLPGTKVNVGIDSSPFDCCPDIYRVQVIWRRALSGKKSRFNFGVGVKYCDRSNCS